MLVYVVINKTEMFSNENFEDYIEGIFSSKEIANEYIRYKGDYDDIVYLLYAYTLNEPGSQIELYT